VWYNGFMEFTAEQWGRFIYWSNQNSAAITALATVVLVAVTAWYAWLTRLALAAVQAQATAARDQLELGQKQTALIQRQFQAAYLPELHMLLRSSRDDRRLVSYRIVNIGQRAAQVQSVVLELEPGGSKWKESLKDYEGGTLLPAQPPKPDDKVFEVRLPEDVLPDGYSPQEEAQVLNTLVLTVVVSDQAGLIRYECQMRLSGTRYRIKVLSD
jgi:hypothetical protein